MPTPPVTPPVTPPPPSPPPPRCSTPDPEDMLSPDQLAVAALLGGGGGGDTALETAAPQSSSDTPPRCPTPDPLSMLSPEHALLASLLDSGSLGGTRDESPAPQRPLPLNGASPGILREYGGVKEYMKGLKLLKKLKKRLDVRERRAGPQRGQARPCTRNLRCRTPSL